MVYDIPNISLSLSNRVYVTYVTYHLNEAAPIIVPKAYLSLYLSQYALMTASCHSGQLIYACTLQH